MKICRKTELLIVRYVTVNAYLFLFVIISKWWNILINAFGLFTYTVYEGVICVDNDLRALTGVVIDAGHGGLWKIQKIK